jgi:hypothetical protein
LIIVIANTLLLGIGIALNPVAAVASILVLRDARTRFASAAFVLGWVLGLVVLVAVSSWVALDQIGKNRQAVLATMPIIWIGIGVVLFGLGLRSLLGQLPDAGEAEPPRWMGLLNQERPVKIAGIGLFLSTFSLRNLALLAAAVTIVSQADLSLIELLIAAGVFVAASSLGVLVPPLVRAIGGLRADAVLEALAAWLIRNMSRITGGFLLLIGAYLLARGILNLR